MQPCSRAAALTTLVILLVLGQQVQAARAPKPTPTPTPTPSPSPSPSPIYSGNMTLQWADEFPVGTGLNPNNWIYMYGDGSVYGLNGWGNNELECYTNSSLNSAIVADPANATNGLLQITAVYSKGKSCWNQYSANTTRDWTSARVATWGKRSFQPAMNQALKVEARVKLPMNQGSWPAFWMLPDPNSTPYGNWCASGEIDIMEHVNSEQQIHGTVHYGGGSGSNSSTNCSRSEGIKYIADNQNWHTHAIVWSSSYVAWLIDDVEYYRSGSGQWWSGNAIGTANAPFNSPFYILLNLAVGGVWPGNPANTTSFSYFIDYVRVWQMPL